VNEQDFRRPPPEYGPVAMWFLNAELEEAELRRQIDAVAAGGVGGIQVAARTGLRTPYLSEHWFQAIELIQDAAARHGLRVWLADEYPYPSGASGGEVVLRHPELRAWQMHATQLKVRSGERVSAVAPGTILLRACGVPIFDGLPRWPDAIDLAPHVGWVQQRDVLYEPSQVYLTTKRYMSNAPRPTLNWNASGAADHWEIWLIAAAELADYKFFGSYVDLCNADATRLFLKTTHERYLARLGPERFARLAGFFLDEAHPQNWSWCLPEFFQRRHGYDLVQVLPALWTDVGPRTARIRYDYRQSVTELFDESFMRPVADWCSQHQVDLSLEVPSTRNIVQRHATVPGIDPGHDKVGVPLDDILVREMPSFRGNLGFPASLAAQTGKRRVLDELFHSVGWSLTLQDMKAMLDRSAARGANLFTFHAFCYSIGGLRKWDAPPSEFEQNPYWPHFALLADYASRLASALSQGRRVAPIAVLDPITSLWSHAALPGLELDDIGRHVMQKWTSIMRDLLAAQRPYDHLDPLLLTEATLDGVHLRIGDALYQVVVLPSLISVEQAAWTKLAQFAAAGGTVIACGSLPSEMDDADSEVTPFAHLQANSLAELLKLLDQLVPTDLRLIVESGDLRNVLVAQRRDGDDDLYLLANSSMSEVRCEIALRRPDARVVRMDLESGGAEEVPTWQDDIGTVRARLEFARHGAHLLRVSPHSTVKAPPTPLPTVHVGLDGDWRVDLANPAENVLRMDRFRFTLGDVLHWPVDTPVVEPKPLVNLLRDISNASAQWPARLQVQPIFGAPPRVDVEVPATAWYATSLDVRVLPRRALLCLESTALAGDWQIWLNGQPVAEFLEHRRWSNETREADVAHFLRPGMNELLVRIHVSDPAGGLVDAIYLLGDFGVFLPLGGAPVLDHLPNMLRWAERHDSGYPYYSGSFQLRKRIGREVPSGAFRLRLPDEDLMFAGVVEAWIDARPLGVRAWAPYAWTVPYADSPFELSLEITTTLVEQLEGKRYDPPSRRTVPVISER